MKKIPWQLVLTLCLSIISNMAWAQPLKVGQPKIESKTEQKTEQKSEIVTAKVARQSLSDVEILEQVIDEAFADEIFSKELTSQKLDVVVDSDSLMPEPEILLNQLDDSDLMDFVAEDDLWKEELIEDEDLL